MSADVAWTPPEPADAEQACPIGPAVEVVFSRWTTPILWTLDRHGRQRFVELQGRLPSITPKVLTDTLRRMERDGVITRTYHPEVPPRVEYEISDLGRTLAPLFAHLNQWATANMSKVDQSRHAYDTRPPR
ncbi:HxlR family transcriptional regulator [Sphaerisporangium siamense]|uniref:DNA-binding HxlR family transcriptional regulator n=1 Tax=Sphaerisporangium siamense TaxID=795645 RepID=A0A7W7DC67_9ACTN|nr:helix-turn-helix domain-containing protein [Sphaerisporangium siamense]MBB4704112.1 DNA-binding HxlR family transcriptional regulator [Sphaerisporangium siamense]GII82589.1 HxlR family transcriptional regulator [Sphaerisporangium siamense]